MCKNKKNIESSKNSSKAYEVYKGIQSKSNKWLKLACEEALISAKTGGGPFGAVIVQINDDTGEVIRYWKGSNHVTKSNDPTAHAEVSVIRIACKDLGVFDLGKIYKQNSKLPQECEISHCEIYASCEPCPMCYSAICWSRIPSLIFGATRFDAASNGVDFSDKDIYDELELPYDMRAIVVRQGDEPSALDAFNYWKNSDNIKY